MTLTIYDKELIASLQKMFPENEDTAALVEKLIRMGVVDNVRCKILAVRTFVYELVKCGGGKVDSMYVAAEKFCCSYEYVRKCMYYYKDVDIA